MLGGGGGATKQQEKFCRDKAEPRTRRENSTEAEGEFKSCGPQRGVPTSLRDSGESSVVMVVVVEPLGPAP